MRSDDLVPEWIVSLADDHLESLRMLFRAAGDKQTEADALSIQRLHGIFPKSLENCADVSVARSVLASPAALAAAERRSRREIENLSDQIALAGRNSAQSMRDTLEMMCSAMARAGRHPVSDETMGAWNCWFARRLENELKSEHARLKRRLLQQRRKRRSVLSVHPSRTFGVTRPGTEAQNCSDDMKIDDGVEVDARRNKAEEATGGKLQTDNLRQLQGGIGGIAEWEGGMPDGNRAKRVSRVEVIAEDQAQSYMDCERPELELK